ncbi:hypothetical protein CPB86DRAFT_793368 [Serendipita vermifera]|nr:hypothetical protein CPB86DRAFT_793368 [Serendipita vermifera]
MQSSYSETFSLPEPIHDLGNTWDTLGLPPSMREQVISDHVLPTDLHLKEEEVTRFDNLPYWPLSTTDPAQPYLSDTFSKTQTPMNFGLDPNLPAESLPPCSPAELSPNGFPPSSYTPTLSPVSSASSVQETQPVPIITSETPQLLSPAFPVRHSREDYRQKPDLLIDTIVPKSADPTLRMVLHTEVLTTDWWYKNEKEPRKTFAPFIKKHTAGGQRQFECLLCGKKNMDNWDAIRDARHRPYRCEAPRGCDDPTCKMAFYTNDCLKSHRSKNEQRCNVCGATVEDKDLGRHQKTQNCRRVAGLST